MRVVGLEWVAVMGRVTKILKTIDVQSVKRSDGYTTQWRCKECEARFVSKHLEALKVAFG